MSENLRLSKSTRDFIVQAAIKHSFEKDTERLAKAEDKLARKAYDAVIPKAEQRLVAELPKRWFGFNSKPYFNVAGRRISLAVQGDPVPIPHSSSFETGVIEARSALASAIDAHLAAKEDLKRRRVAAEIALGAMLSNVYSLKTLAEVWPEGRQFYRHLKEQPPRNLPTLRIDEVNAMLGLKKAA